MLFVLSQVAVGVFLSIYTLQILLLNQDVDTFLKDTNKGCFLLMFFKSLAEADELFSGYNERL